MLVNFIISEDKLTFSMILEHINKHIKEHEYIHNNC